MIVPFYVLKVVSDVNAHEEIRAKMFEQHLGNVSDHLAEKIYEFLVCLDSL